MSRSRRLAVAKQRRQLHWMNVRRDVFPGGRDNISNVVDFVPDAVLLQQVGERSLG